MQIPRSYLEPRHELVKGSLPGVPNQYPIDDICVRRNDPATVQTIKQHGDLPQLHIRHISLLRTSRTTR